MMQSALEAYRVSRDRNRGIALTPESVVYY